jgi:hypothetical protein
MLNRIKIDLDRTVGDIDRNVFGGFVEHLGRCVYGGIYDPTSPGAVADGLREDVRLAIDGLRLSNIRYPGGNFVSGYRWRDGVGPVEDRAARPDLAWGAIEPNTFGPNEFVRFCRKIGVEPYFVVNCGDGDLHEARDWVEYCNGTSDTTLARLRAAHGFPEPHRIRYWGIGNEVDGAWQIGAKSPTEYARAYHEFAKAMRWTDPTIQLIASATSDWDGDIVGAGHALTERPGPHRLPVDPLVRRPRTGTSTPISRRRRPSDPPERVRRTRPWMTLRRAGRRPRRPRSPGGRRVERLVPDDRRSRGDAASSPRETYDRGRSRRGDAPERLHPPRGDRSHGRTSPSSSMSSLPS